MTKPKQCNEREELFAQGIVKHGDRHKAMVDAGYKTVHRQMSHKLLRRAHVKARIDELYERAQLVHDMDQHWFRKEWRDLYMRCISGDKLDAAGANKALENLAKLQGLAMDKLALVGPDGGPIQLESNTWSVQPVRAAGSKHSADVVPITSARDHT